MAFNSVLKLRVRMKAAYRCCWCERFGMVEVHHIVPQAENGPDDEANARHFALVATNSTETTRG